MKTTEVMDRKARDMLSSALERLIAGNLSIEECLEMNPRKTRDFAVRMIWRFAHLLCDGDFICKFGNDCTGVNSQRSVVRRCVRFLSTDLEYNGDSEVGSICDLSYVEIANGWIVTVSAVFCAVAIGVDCIPLASIFFVIFIITLSMLAIAHRTERDATRRLYLKAFSDPIWPFANEKDYLDSQ